MRDINASGYQYNEFRDFSTSPFDVLKEILVEDSQLDIYVCVCVCVCVLGFPVYMECNI